MEKRRLGRTELQISALSLGGAAFGNMYGTLDKTEAEATIRQAIEMGINLIDTSPFYGETRSETVLGELITPQLRKQIYLCTKAGRHKLDVFDFTSEGIKNSLDKSLQRLNTDYVDILIAHDIEFCPDFQLIVSETIPTLEQLKKTGKCRFIGVSGYPLEILKQAIEIAPLDVIISYGHFTLQNQLLVTDLIPLTHQKDIGLMNASPLGMGLLTSQGAPSWHPAPENWKELVRSAAALCQQNGTDLAFLSMQYAFQESAIATTITGTAKQSELNENFRAFITPINRELVKQVQAILAPILNRSWA